MYDIAKTIEKMKADKASNKELEQLLYTVHCARENGITWKQIYKTLCEENSEVKKMTLETLRAKYYRSNLFEPTRLRKVQEFWKKERVAIQNFENEATWRA